MPKPVLFPKFSATAMATMIPTTRFTTGIRKRTIHQMGLPAIFSSTIAL
jgi:hypothetical protein